MGTASREGSATRLDGVPFSFSESLSGRFLRAGADSSAGHADRARSDTRIRLDVRIDIPDLGRCLRDLRHPGRLSGRLFLPCLGGEFRIEAGRFEMFSVDPRSGRTQMVYEFGFTAPDGQVYFLHGHKVIAHEAWTFDIARDMTRLFVTVHVGTDRGGPVCGSGEIRFRLLDVPRLLASMQVDAASSWRQRAAARIAFLSVAEGALRDEYFSGIRFFYDACYENLVLSGTAIHGRGDEATSCFLVSGVHDKGCPWGDGELFSDVLLVMGNRSSGYRRYCVADRALSGLEFDVTSGAYTYSGPMFAPRDGYATSFADLTGRADGLLRLHADIDIRFHARAGEAVPFPFPRTSPLLRRIRSRLSRWLSGALPGTHLPGIYLRPHAVTIASGSIRIRGSQGEADDWVLEPSRTFGEAERGSFRNVKRPTLGYRYTCAVDASRRSAVVRVCASTLHRRRRIDALVGRLVSRVGSTTYRVSDEGTTIDAEAPSGRLGDDHAPTRPLPVLEVRHGQFPTAVFLRRVVEVDDEAGGCSLALEEDMAARTPPGT